MSLHNLANELQKKGRGKDQMLVHMTPKEVAGLQAIAKAHGGSLTVNPDTGLVEAGFLDNLLPSLLPMAAGAALSPFITPMGAAMLVGGATGLATGSVEKGLMAGLGAYGGAGLTDTLAQNATTQAATNAAQAGAIPQATTAGGTAMTSGVDAGTQALGAASGNAPVATTQMPYAPGATGQLSPSVTAAQTGTTAPTTTGQRFTFDQLKSGASNTFGSLENTGKFVGQNYGKIGMAAAPTMAAAMEPEPYQPPEKKKYSSGYTLSPDFQGYVPQRPNPYYAPTGLGYAGGGDVKKEESSLQLPTSGGDGFGQIANLTVNALEGRSSPNDPVARLVNAMQGKFGSQPQAAVTGNSLEYQIDPRTGAVYVPQGLGYAGGGLMDVMMARGGSFDDQPGMDGFKEGGVAKKPAKAKAIGARNIANMDPYDASMAELNNARYGANMSQLNMPKAGIASLGDLPYAAGGIAGGRYLKGAGDGMSDSIPATINGKQPARLADGEFVVPADVVSHLGNGSSDAGAKKLYAMMDKIRTARTGKKKQAPAVKADKYLPA